MGGLQHLGWLQFERLCALLLEAESGISEAQWDGSADRERLLVTDEPVRFAGRTLEPPVTVRCAWARGNADARTVRLAGLRDVSGSALTFVNGELEADHLVVGEQALLAAIDRHPEVRLQLPS